MDWTKIFDQISKTVSLFQLAERYGDIVLLELAKKEREIGWQMFCDATNCDVNANMADDLSRFFSRK